MKSKRPLPYLAAAVLAVHVFVLYSPAGVNAEQGEAIQQQEVIDRANYLKGLLDNLLVSPNVSSIRKITESGNEQVNTLIDQAMALRTQGEDALAEQKYLDSVSSFQSSIEHVFQAIRAAEQPVAEEDRKTSVRLARRLEVNQTFIAAATRVVSNEPNEDAMQLLRRAKEGRSRAEAESKQGSEEQALVELDNSTSLAKRAIIAVRGGQVIERKTESPPQAAQ